ncbi:MAG: hemolysin family protein [Nitrospira sp.]
MIEVVVIVVCLLCNAMLAAAEMAFVAVSRPVLRQLARQGHKKAVLLLALREVPERTLSVIQIGITVVGALAGAVGGAGAEELLSPILETRFGISASAADTISIALVVVPLVYFTVVIGELMPKSLALRNSLKVALFAAPWLAAFDKLLGPIVTLLEWSTKRLLQLLRALRLWDSGQTQELKASDQVDTTVSLETLSSQHRQYVLNLVDLESKTMKEIFVPWSSVVTIESTQPPNEVERVILTSGHTRLPVMGGGRVIGILNSKEFMALRASSGEDWAPLVRPPVVLQAGTPLLTGLRSLQERRMHMGVVYADRVLLGIVTLEDILEEVIGEIYDEDDDGKLKRLLSTTPRTLRLGRALEHR